MLDPAPQTAEGKVLWHFTMSLDGFVAGPEHSMDWMRGVTLDPALSAAYVATTGAVLAGRTGFDRAIGSARPYGGAWQGPIFVMTHHPQDAPAVDGITMLDCSVEDAIQIARDAAQGRNVEVFSTSIGAQLLDAGLLDEIDLHIAPVLLGDGTRLYHRPGAAPARLRRRGDNPTAAVTVRYQPERPVA